MWPISACLPYSFIPVLTLCRPSCFLITACSLCRPGWHWCADSTCMTLGRISGHHSCRRVKYIMNRRTEVKFQGQQQIWMSRMSVHGRKDQLPWNVTCTVVYKHAVLPLTGQHLRWDTKSATFTFTSCFPQSILQGTNATHWAKNTGSCGLGKPGIDSSTLW